MRLPILSVAALAIAGAASAAVPRPEAPAANAPAAPPSLPRLFAQAGYAEPAIPASACRVVNAGQTTCTLPAMTAGRYFARATGASTATAAGGAQQITIVAGDQHCTSTYAPDPKRPWAVGAKRSFSAGCVFTVLTDEPLSVTAAYFDQNATKDPAGPTLSIYPQAWSGALSGLPVEIRQ
jgi:hypothetical protein